MGQLLGFICGVRCKTERGWESRPGPLCKNGGIVLLRLKAEGSRVVEREAMNSISQAHLCGCRPPTRLQVHTPHNSEQQLGYAFGFAFEFHSGQTTVIFPPIFSSLLGKVICYHFIMHDRIWKRSPKTCFSFSQSMGLVWRCIGIVWE